MQIEKEFGAFAILVVFVFFIAGCATIPAIGDFQPKPLPIIDYSEYESSAPLEMVVPQGGSFI